MRVSHGQRFTSAQRRRENSRKDGGRGIRSTTVFDLRVILLPGYFNIVKRESDASVGVSRLLMRGSD